MKSRIPLLIAAAAAAALALPGAAQAYYPSGPQQNVSRSAVAASGWTVCYTSTFAQDWQYLGNIDAACNAGEGRYMMLATGVSSDPDNWTLLAAAPRSTVVTTYPNNPALRNTTISANGSEWHRGTHTSWGFAPAGDTVDHDWEVCDRGTTNPTLRMCWNAWADTLTFGGRVGTTFVPMSGPELGNYTRAVLMLDPRVRMSGTPVAFPTQPLSTVSAKRTVTLTVSGDPGLTDAERESGKLTLTGTNADEFDVVDNDCSPVVAPDNGSLTCTVTVRFVPQASGPRTAALGFANAVGAVALAGNGGQLPPGPAGPRRRQGRHRRHR